MQSKVVVVLPIEAFTPVRWRFASRCCNGQASVTRTRKGIEYGCMVLLMLFGVLCETRMLTIMFIEVLLLPDGLVGGRWKRRSQDGLARIVPKTFIEQIVQHTKGQQLAPAT